MRETGPEYELLVNRLLADDELAEFRSRSLGRMLSLARETRRKRRTRRTLALALLPVLTLTAGTLLILMEPSNAHVPAVRAHAELEGADPVESRIGGTSNVELSIRRLTDEELFALFPGRPVALIGSAENQKLVFLDEQGVAASVNPSHDPGR